MMCGSYVKGWLKVVLDPSGVDEYTPAGKAIVHS
jgi:hypothetical protein